MCAGISGSMNSSHCPLHLTFSPPRGRSIGNMRRPALSIFYSRRKRMSKQTKEKTGRLWMLKRKMEMKNLKLYMENKSILEANEKLRKKAALLHLENLALHSQLQINSPIKLGFLPNQVQ